MPAASLFFLPFFLSSSKIFLFQAPPSPSPHSCYHHRSLLKSSLTAFCFLPKSNLKSN